MLWVYILMININLNEYELCNFTIKPALSPSLMVK